MKTSRLIAALVAIAFVALAVADASAMYNPATGTFLQRDSATGDAMRLGASPAIGGQFLPRDTEDEVGNVSAGDEYADGMNLYQYGRSSPVNRVDPDGHKARVTVDESNCSIVVTINIGIYGPRATEAVAGRIKRSIESHWAGFSTKKGCGKSDCGGCGVVVAANVKYYKDAKHWPDVPEDNQIKIREKRRSWTAGSWGHWSDNPLSPDWSYAHEAGHLMGLGDDYYDNIFGQLFLFEKPKSTPFKGHEGHMMAEPWGDPAQHEVDSIIQGAKCPEKCCKKSP